MAWTWFHSSAFSRKRKTNQFLASPIVFFFVVVFVSLWSILDLLLFLENKSRDWERFDGWQFWIAVLNEMYQWGYGFLYIKLCVIWMLVCLCTYLTGWKGKDVQESMENAIKLFSLLSIKYNCNIYH